MPTPEYEIPIVSPTTSITQHSNACPTPLTPPLEVRDLESSTVALTLAAQTSALNARNEYGSEMVSNNTADGMAASQEDSLYIGLATTPDVERVDMCPTNEKDKMDFLHDTNSGVTLGQTADIVASIVPDLPVAPLSPASLSFSPPRQHLEDAPNQCDLSHNNAVQGLSTDKTPENDMRLPHISEPVQNNIAYPSNQGYVMLKGATKVDRELDWTSNTPFFDFTHRRADPKYPSSVFQCDSRYKGTQQSDRQIYNVFVRILTVDMEQCTCTGYLTIKELTPEHDTLQTYFTGEIIGGPDQKYSFRTKTPEWGANDKTDLGHWARFPAWRPYAKPAKNVDFAFPPNGEHWWQQENIFMRWKEHFLVPDHKTRSIAGASFEGFYYICLNQVEGKISGIYFHSKSEKYQKLELKHEGDAGVWHRGVTPSVEFR